MLSEFVSQKIWKSVHCCRSYHKNKSGQLFWDTPYCRFLYLCQKYFSS